ncbi:MAG: REP-associated tyrosine transposase [Acidobacteriaceae bacterium]
MTIPFRGRTSRSTYFITSSTFEKRALLQKQQYAELLLEVISENRAKGRFLLHAYVIMPDHIHLLITPGQNILLERAVQFIKGGFSFRMKKELGYSWDVWQTSFYDRRVRDWEEFQRLRQYIHLNPVRRHLVPTAEEYSFSSAKPCIPLDEVPQRLNPLELPVA